MVNIKRQNTMNLDISLNNFKKAINIVSRFVSPKQQLPILGNILFKAQKTRLVIQGTNLESSVSISIPVRTYEEGLISIPGKLITEISPVLTGENIKILSDKEHLKIEATNSISEILGMNATDFPDVPDSVKNKTFIVSLPKLRLALEKILFSLGVEESRPVLTGVLFELNKDNHLVLVGTDGFRLSRKIIDVDLVGDFERVIIPKSILYEILKIEDDQDLFVEVKKEDGQIIFGLKDLVFSSRVIAGEYPPYQKIIPSDYILKFTADKDDLIKAVKLGSVFSRDSGNAVKLQVKGKKLRVFAESSSSGKQETEIEIKIDEGSAEKETFVVFNYKFLEDVLKAVISDDIGIEINGSDRAAKFLDSQDFDFFHLIMPIKNN